MLWLCLRFPLLALEVFPPDDGPVVVTARQRVVCANAAAQAAGIAPGLRLAAALGLAPGLNVREQQAPREAELLHMLACWAEGFTPQVSVAPPDELLLEIGGCVRLFGGLAALCDKALAELQAQGLTAVQAVAPTPLGAQWLARAEDAGPCESLLDLPTRLAPLPLAVLGELDGPTTRTLAALGVRALGDLFTLPAAGLRRRFGGALPLWLAQARGEVPDLRESFIFPEHFEQRLELPAKVSDASMLLFAARRLMASLAGWLAARSAGVAECSLLLEHEDGLPPTVLTLAFAEATADLARLERVLRERIERCRLTAQVWRLQLVAAAPQPLAGRTLGLFGQEAALALAPVIERLRARLGKDAVHGLTAVADHRPECASRVVAEGAPAAAGLAAGAQPLWLLPAPQALSERDGVPQRGGNLLRLAGPARIESGWWEQGEQREARALIGDVQRDYFVACSPRGEWLWVFRDARGWWLHGLFA
ncbi:DNA polymerase Y family protein [Uliginosibacterium flavum]|uniref:DNA polymerase Y family protein n=1 Tax=Uliginosibacterium flavum TaxID=1396831 RepID=A0ABV2TG48_9RHOO